MRLLRQAAYAARDAGYSEVHLSTVSNGKREGGEMCACEWAGTEWRWLRVHSHWAEPRAKSIDFEKVSPRTNERYGQDRYRAGNMTVLVPTTYYQYKKRNRRKRITCQSESRIHPASIPS